ncbi:MAG: alpha/beta hydrolase [Candidatus Micrarchaeota archaeon]
MLVTNIDHRPAREQKTTIVTINGWACKKKDWNALEPLCESGFGFFRFDRQGYVPGYFRTLARELLDELKVRNIESPCLVVHSMGGLAAIAYLNLVREPGYEQHRPKAVVFVTPALSDPRESFPKDDKLIRLGSAFTRWRANRIVNAIEDGKLPYRNMGFTITAFQLASPFLFRHLGAEEQVKREFARFLRETKTHDKRTTLMEFYAMCSEGRQLENILIAGKIWMPEKVLVISGHHDLFIDNNIAATRIFETMGNDSEVVLRTIDRTGHFPALEAPDEFRRLVTEII